MNFKYIFGALIYLSISYGQSQVFESNPGYIIIESDTSAVPIYVDGILMGHTPIKNPIPVLQGPHSISHHPPSLKDPFIQYGLIDGMKQVYVFSDDTVRVYLNTMILDKELKRVKSEYRYTNYIGIGLIFLLIWQLWIISS